MSKLIPEVIAQSEPTFPYDGPFEEPEQPSTPSEAVLKLSTTSSTLQTGSIAVCDLKIESGNEEVESYSIIISFNASVLEVVDANASQTGVQINFLDEFSDIQTNSANNTTGTIQITALTSGAAQTMNRNIAQITLRAKAVGTSVVSINRSQSEVMNDQDTNILGSTTSLNFTVTGTSGEEPPGPDGQVTPASGISDTLATLGSVLSGLLMLYVGIKMVIDKKRGKEIGI